MTESVRLPPHSPEAEQGFLGCLMLDARQVMMDCEALIGPDSFFDLRHQTIYNAARAILDRGHPVDLVTVNDQLKRETRHEIEQSYLIALLDTAPSAANARYYAEILEEKATLREIIRVCTVSVAAAYDEAKDVEDILSLAEQNVMKIRRKKCGDDAPIKELVHAAIDEIERLHATQGSISGLSTGFVDIDRASDGMHPGEMIVLAAYPSMGKSTMLTNIIEHVSIDLKQPSLLFSLEMKGKRIVMRMLASRSRVNMRNIRDGFMSERDFPKITGSATKLAVAPIHIVETSDLSISQLKAKCRQVSVKQGIKFIGIDYLQLVKGNLRRDGNREQEVASISRGVKELAGEMDCPVMVLSQLNDDGKLRESRAIGQDADSLWKLSPEDTENTNDCIPVNLEMRKQRDGPAPFTVKLTFLKQFTRFECAARMSPEDSNLPFKD